MDKLERVARAIAYSGIVHEHREWEGLLPESRRHYLQQAQAAIAAIEPMDRPRVKPLVWEDHPADDGPVMSKAVALHGTYFIVDDTDDFSGLHLQLISHDKAQWWQHVRATCDTLLEGIHDDDLGPLKAAAQADYEARILAAIEPVTVQEMPEVLTSEQLADACLWHRHDYGIVSKGEQEARRRAANDWWRAFRRALAERGVMPDARRQSSDQG